MKMHTIMVICFAVTVLALAALLQTLGSANTTRNIQSYVEYTQGGK